MTFWQSIVLAVAKNLPLLAGFCERLTKHPLSGVWCVCYQCGKGSDEYEIGSMDIKQIGRRIIGSFYTGDKRWDLYAKKDASAFVGSYRVEDKSTGAIRFNFSGENTDRLIGTWSGKVSIKTDRGIEEDVQYMDGLNLFAARSRSVNTQCHKKQIRFGECHKAFAQS